MNAVTLAQAQVLLADNDKGRGSPIGLFVILALCVAVYFLWKSLNRHLKKLPESFDKPRPGTQTDAQTATQTDAQTGIEAGITTEPAVPPDDRDPPLEPGDADR